MYSNYNYMVLQSSLQIFILDVLQCIYYVLTACLKVCNITLCWTPQTLQASGDKRQQPYQMTVPTQLLLLAYSLVWVCYGFCEGQIQCACQQSMMQHIAMVGKQHVQERAPLKWVWNALAWRKCFVDITSSDIVTCHAWQCSLKQSPAGAARKNLVFAIAGIPQMIQAIQL